MKRLTCLTLGWFAAAATAGAADYLVLVSKASAADPAWKKVGDTLADNHRGTCEIWDGSEAGLLAALKQSQPRYLAIVAKPEKFSAAIVRSINRATRAVDTDPWTDCRWGLITGNTAEDALRLVKTRQPLIIQRALTTTGIDLGLVESGLTLSDGGKGGFTRKLPGQSPEQGKWSEADEPAGTVTMFADCWNQTDPQLLVTSSHATQFNLEMPFGLGLIASHGGKFHVLTMQQRNEFAKFLGGAMFTGNVSDLGKWLDGTNAPTLKASTAPKVWVASGNCLIGDAKGTGESMVATALSTAGFRQFVGYVVPTWFGRGGWGTSGLWQGSRGGLSLAEAFYLNQQQLVDETMTRFPGAEKVVFNSDDIESGLKTDKQFIEGLQALEKGGMKIEKDVLGLIHDRDVVAFWGDPLWDARFDPKRSPHPLQSNWRKDGDGLTLTLEASADFAGSFPLWLPERIARPELKAPAEVQLDALAADDFLLIRKVTLKKGEKLELSIQRAKA
jgi:zinc protease